MSEILLINPPSHSWYSKDLFKSISIPPLGILYIAAYIMRYGYDVSIHDMTLHRLKQEEFTQFLKKNDPQVVGITCTTETINSAYQICKAVKEWNPKCYTILGGPHPTVNDIEAVSNSNVDIVVRNEGEITMLLLVRALLENDGKLDDIKGITYSIGDNVHKNSDADLISDLDILPLPARDLLEISEYAKPGAIITSRGCPNHCSFCAASTISGKKYRFHSAKRVYEEMALMNDKYSCDYIIFTDNTLTANKPRLQELCEFIIKEKLEIPWQCESRADTIDKEVLELMSKAGCKKIQFGLESGSEGILSSVRKGITRKQIEDAVRDTREIGMTPACSFMIGQPNDTHETLQQTFEFVKKLQRDYGAMMFCSINTPFPGTEQYIRRNELGLKLLSHNWDNFLMDKVNIETKYLSSSDIQRWYFEIGTHILQMNQNIKNKDQNFGL